MEATKTCIYARPEIIVSVFPDNQLEICFGKDNICGLTLADLEAILECARWYIKGE